MAFPAFLVFKLFSGGGPRTPLHEVHMEKLHIFSNRTSAPHLKCVLMIQIIVIYLLSVCDCQIIKTTILWSVVYLFVAYDHD